MMLNSLAIILSSFLFAVVNGLYQDGDPSVSLSEGSYCRTRDNQPGYCSRIENCEIYYEGLRTKTIKYSFLIRCSFIGFYEIVCCPLRSERAMNNAITATPTVALTAELATASISTPTTAPTKIPFRTKTDVEQTISLKERPSQAACRRYRESNPASLSYHILDGVEASLGEFPHMGALIIPDGAVNFKLKCGSSLISERYALTAAHCVNDVISRPTMVRFGVIKWKSRDGDSAPVDIEIEDIFIYDEYRSSMRYHDIALIKLRRDVKFSLFVSPACLNSSMSDLDPDIPLVVIGWGVTDVQTRKLSDVLLKTNVSTVALNDCKFTHEAYGLPMSYKDGLNDGHYCAIDPEYRKDSCQQDSGGPLQLQEKNRLSVVGIVSFGVGCGTAIPSVYARVGFYLNWIESIVWPS